MRSRLPQLFACVLARSGPGATCAAFFLCAVAAAQSVPPGYVATQEGDVIVMRPSAAADPDITIRVYPPVADQNDPAAAARRWAESYPLAGVNPGAVALQDKTMYGVSTLTRAWKDGTRAHAEIIMMPLAGSGRYRPVVARMPMQPGQLLTNHVQAQAHVVALIVRGQFQPNLSADGKGNPAVTAAPAEPAGKPTAPERPATAQSAPAQTQATAELVARAAAEIEAVGFMTRTEMGVGGGFSTGPKAVALFRGGDALLQIDNLIHAASVEADRAAHPRDWGRWKRTAGGIELLEGDKWKKLDYPKTLPRASAGYALSGHYEFLFGGGDSRNMIALVSAYTFQPDGKFSHGRSNILEAARPYSYSKRPASEGRYRVDGYLLRLEPAGGQPENHVIVVDPTFPDVIWIDGGSYTRHH